MNTKGDDEITIDFSKIKKFFSSEKISEDKPSDDDQISEGKKIPSDDAQKQDVSDKAKLSDKHKEKKAKEEIVEKEDEEISIDFSKITNLFKKDKTKREGAQDTVSEKKADDEVSFDLSDLKSIGTNLVKYKVVLFIIIALFLSINLRMYPAELPITDVWARDSVHNYYRNQILTQINQQYPHLPDENKNELVNEEFNKILAEQGDMIEQQIAQTSAQFKQEFKDDKGTTYLLAIDPYFWLRFVENMDELGHIGDYEVDGQQFDDHFLAPVGRIIPKDVFHAYFEYYLLKFLSIFDRDMYAMKAAFLAPVIITSLAVIPAFFIARRIAGDIGGFFAAIMVAIHPSILTRTVAGFADTDPYNVFFPLLITWVFLEAFEARNTKRTIILSSIAGFLIGLFTISWGGWWYIMDFLLATGGLYLMYYIYIHRDSLKSTRTMKAIKEIVILLVVFTVASCIFITLFTEASAIGRIFQGPGIFVNLKEIGVGSIWPNVYTTVAEQNEITMEGVIRQVGGTGLFMLSAVGILLTLLKKDKNGKLDPKYAFLLTLWFGSTMYASTKGVRFLLLLIPAFSIAIGVFAGTVTKYVSQFVSKELKVPKIASTIAVVIVLGLMFVAPFNQARNTAINEIPSMNDAWVRSLEKIKFESSEDAIINSWWDFGHWFKYWADRAVTFDGTSQVGDRAHFIGRVLLTDNEQEAIGILRMLDCGGDRAFITIDEEIDDPLVSIRLVKNLVLLDKSQAKILLLKQFDQEKTEDILQYTHCEPPEDYFITSEDMVSKSGVWAHFGSWDFEKADMVWRVRSKNVVEGVSILQERYGLSATEADQYYYEITTSDNINNWIAPWPSYASGITGCSQSDDLISCGNGVQFNLTEEVAYVDGPQGKMHPTKFSYITQDGEFREITYTENLISESGGGDLGVALIPEGEGYVSVLMDPKLTSSMFTRLFYYKGYGLKHFEPFHFDRDVTGLDIMIWKVNWEGIEE